jgi:hypothetical protein
VTHSTLLEDTEDISRKTPSTHLEDREAVSSVPFPDLREHMEADSWAPPFIILEDRESVSLIPASTYEKQGVRFLGSTHLSSGD